MSPPWSSRSRANRSRRWRRSAQQEVDRESDPAEEVVEQIGLPEERRRVRAALDELPEAQRDVLERMYFDGMSQTQIAEVTGLPLGTVKSRTLLGMRRLRAALIQEEP